MTDKTFLTVSQLNEIVKVKIDEINNNLGIVYLKGEISNFKRHSKGHLYFTIKDANSAISAIMFYNTALQLSFAPKDGDFIEVSGKLSTYSPSGSYSIQVFSMQLSGIGSMFIEYEKIRKKYATLGYFDASHKKSIPNFPKRIGVITSKTGAVIEDIRNTINRRYKLVELLLYPAIVQGPTTGIEISRRIAEVNNEGLVDVLIIGRGGGSMEDLWGFNDPLIIEAIYNSKIPIITAIGHEPDVTLADYVADRVAPTPTAAAEIATPNSEDLIIKIREQVNAIKKMIIDKIDEYRTKLYYFDRRMESNCPLNIVNSFKANYNNLELRLINNYRVLINEYKISLNKIDHQLVSPKERIEKERVRLKNDLILLTKEYSSLLLKKKGMFNSSSDKMLVANPLSVMTRGFGYMSKNNEVFTSVKEINIGDEIDIALADGKIMANVTDIKEEKNGR